MNAISSEYLDERQRLSIRPISQVDRCNKCIYNIEGICTTSPTLDSVKDYLNECDYMSNCGRNKGR